MKVFLKNAIIKKILIVFITIIMTGNFIMPNQVQAGFLNDAGNELIGGFFQLLAYVGDVCLSAMQRMMVGTWDLVEYGEYAIKYSPGLIFSNEIAALDINFISAEESDKDTTTRYLTDVSTDSEMDKLIKSINEKVGNGSLTKETVSQITNISFDVDGDTGLLIVEQRR